MGDCSRALPALSVTCWVTLRVVPLLAISVRLKSHTMHEYIFNLFTEFTCSRFLTLRLQDYPLCMLAVQLWWLRSNFRPLCQFSGSNCSSTRPPILLLTLCQVYITIPRLGQSQARTSVGLSFDGSLVRYDILRD